MTQMSKAYCKMDVVSSPAITAAYADRESYHLVRVLGLEYA